VQLPLIPSPVRPDPELLVITGRKVPLIFVRNLRARRYVLRLRPDSSARVTVPRGGSIAAARQFAERHAPWIEQQLVRLSAQPRRPKEWRIGTKILFRGERVRLEAVEGNVRQVRFDTEVLAVEDPVADLRLCIEKHLWKQASNELPPSVLAHAAVQGLKVSRVTVRNQRSRWGSCSRRRTISLNWRLIQAPLFVCDYIILHELMHLRQMNHSVRFWDEVERVCPDYRTAERWLKQHSTLLRQGRD
jgi:predicted metal-dependent hydrolase